MMQKIWILNMTFQANKQGISDACSMCIVRERTVLQNKVESVPVPPGPLCMNICILPQMHLRFGVCLLI